MSTPTKIKQLLAEQIRLVSSMSWMFSKNPERDFTRSRKLSFSRMITTFLCMEGRSLANELLEQFNCEKAMASVSAFSQQRAKILPEAFETMFRMFTAAADSGLTYKGFRLLAVDGSDLQIALNEKDRDSYFPSSNGQKSYNLLHLDAMYDLLQKTYMDASVVGRRISNEPRALCSMIDRADIRQPAIVIADRGYETYNVMAHIQEKQWKFLIRVKDRTGTGIVSGLDLPLLDTYDVPINLALTRKYTKEVKPLLKERNRYKFLPNDAVLDYLPKRSERGVPMQPYNVSFRVVRFKIAETVYETVVTNLNADLFPPDELKKLYSMRWGIETSFRELKYTVGLLHFHAKKVEYIFQEIFARLTMYNFTELITSHVILRQGNRKYAYKANFSSAIHICRKFFLGNISPPSVEALIARFISPIRPDRKRPRNMTRKTAVSFLYRIA